MNRLAVALISFTILGCVAEPPIPKMYPTVINVQKPITCKKRPIVIAIIDTGFGIGFKGEETAKLCTYGHVDFTEYSQYWGNKKNNSTTVVPKDNHGHGTHIAGIIDGYAKKANINYCLVILKYYNPKDRLNAYRTIQAISYAANIHADFINYSGGGMLPDKEEIAAVKKFLDAGGTFVAAAGNERSDIDVKHYYPAQDDPRVISVGNLKQDGTHAPTSNYGKSVTRWEIGTNVYVYGMYMTGTSQAAAVATGKLLASKKDTCN